MRPSLLFAFAFAVLASVAAPASAAGDPQAGHTLARIWCSSCHLVDNTAGEAREAAPPFATVAKRYGKDRDWLRAWLTQPHPPMPNFNLTRREIDDIIAYLGSLPQS